MVVFNFSGRVECRSQWNFATEVSESAKSEFGVSRDELHDVCHSSKGDTLHHFLCRMGSSLHFTSRQNDPSAFTSPLTFALMSWMTGIWHFLVASGDALYAPDVGIGMGPI